MNVKKLSIAYSPCPNDTFIFHALAAGLVRRPGIEFEPPLLEDVETLNLWAMEGRMDVTKLSFHAYGHVAGRYFLLRSGSALGRGCGPLLITRPELAATSPAGWKIAIPGRYTTAAMLLRLFASGAPLELVEARFDRIIPMIVSGAVDAGVIIHESRFTYQEVGLVRVVDLGQWWEEESGLPIPLGGIAVRRELGADAALEVEAAVRESLEHAFADPGAGRGYVREHAREMDDGVLCSHIELYVNRFSLELGREGEAAVLEFLRRGREAGLFAAGNADVFPPAADGQHP